MTAEEAITSGTLDPDAQADAELEEIEAPAPPARSNADQLHHDRKLSDD